MPYRVNYKSDFDFLLRLSTCIRHEDGTCEKRPIGWPTYDWDAVFWTSNRANTFKASKRGDKLTNCFNDNGEIHIVCDNHHLGKGVLNVEFRSVLPRGIYADGSEDIYEPRVLDIELVAGQGDCARASEVELLLPYIKGDKGDPFTYEDFTEEQLAGLQKPALDAADRADKAVSELRSVSEKITEQEDARVEAEKSRVAAEQGRVNAEKLRAEAEEARVKAEQSRVTAENKRDTNETERVKSEEKRATAETNRTVAETERETAETQRSIAEQARDTAEQTRVSAEGKRAASESKRETAEQARENAEKKRSTAESQREDAEKTRDTAEQSRKATETQRASDESGRVKAEEKRVLAETERSNAEQSRKESEAVRVSAEEARAKAEVERASAETKREVAETSRKEAEKVRASAETQRVTNEQARQDAETKRATDFDTIKSDATTAIGSATQAAKTASDAAAEIPENIVTYHTDTDLESAEPNLVTYDPTEQEVESLEPNIITDALRKTEQYLTESEQAQVLNNLGNPELKTFIDLWNSRCFFHSALIVGKYDPDNAPDAEHPFEANELWFTYEEAVDVYVASHPKYCATPLSYAHTYPNVKTVLPSRPYGDNNFNVVFNYCNGLVNVRLLTGYHVDIDKPVKCIPHFYLCTALERVLNIITPLSDLSKYTFQGCISLYDLKFHLDRSECTSIDLTDVSKWSFESVQYTVNNKTSDVTIIITVHPDVYAKLTDPNNSQWYQLLIDAADKNIQFATV